MLKLKKEWLTKLRLVSDSRLEYRNDFFIIKIHPYNSNGAIEQHIRVYDINTSDRLDNYTWHIFNDIAALDITPDLEDDNYLFLLLSRILSDLQIFLQRKEELYYFQSCQDKFFLTVDTNLFQIDKCEVFCFSSVSEKRFYRARKDDRFEITTVNHWYIKYNKSIIKNQYLQSLLPEPVTIITSEYAYASTFLGDDIKQFVKDDTLTKNLHKSFSAFLFSQNNQ